MESNRLDLGRTMKRIILILWIVYMSSLIAARSPVAFQQVDNDLLEVQIRNAKILYQKNQGTRAVQLMKKLVMRYPNSAEANYILSVLLFKVKKDKRGMEKYYKVAHQLNPSYRSPLELSEAELNEILSVQRTDNTADLNLKIQLKEVERYIQWKYWDKAASLFQRAGDFVPEASLYYRNLYYLNGLILEDHFGNELQAILYYQKIHPESLPQDKKQVYQQLDKRWSRQVQKFEKRYRNRNLATQKIDMLTREKKYRDLLLFISLIYPYYQDNSDYRNMLDLYRLEALVEVGDIHHARQLADSLHWMLTSIDVPQTYVIRLVELTKKVLFQETLLRIARQKRVADSLMLRGHYQEGMAYYERFLRQQEAMSISPDLIYYNLSSIHMKIGYYDRARDYLKKINRKQFSEELIVALEDSIRQAEKYEERWHREMTDIQVLVQQNQNQKAREMLVSLVRSPYLRFGLKDSTYSVLSSIYLKMGKYVWAREMADLAEKYSTGRKLELLNGINQAYLYSKFNNTTRKDGRYVYFYFAYTKPVEYTIYTLEQKRLMMGVADENQYLVSNSQRPIQLLTRNSYYVKPALEKNMKHLYAGAGFLIGWSFYFLAR